MKKILQLLFIFLCLKGHAQLTTSTTFENGVKMVTIEDYSKKQASTGTNASPCDQAFNGIGIGYHLWNKYSAYVEVFLINGATPPYTYEWTHPDGTVQNGNPLTGITNPGIYHLQITDSNGCVSQVYDLTVEGCLLYEDLEYSAQPTSILTPGGNDGSIQLNVTKGSGLYVYNWTGPNGFTSNNQSVSNLSVGTYYLHVRDSNCYDLILTDTFEIEPYHFCNAFHITSNFVVDDQSQDTASIFNQPTGGTAPYTYNWIYPDGTTSSSQNLTGLNQIGDYQLIITDANGCQSSAITQNIQGCLGLPDANYSKTIFHPSVNFVQDGSILVQVSGASGSWTYEWSNSTFTSTDKNLYGIPAGVYYFTAKDSLCKSLNVYDTINLHVTSVENKSIASLISAYPNPTSGFITLELENVQSELSISVYNLMGQTVYTNSIQQLNAKENIDLSQHSNGIYFIQLTSQEGEKELIKIIKR